MPISISDAAKAIVQKFPKKAAKPGFKPLVEAMLEAIGQEIWRSYKWSFAKKTKGGDGDWIDFVAGTGEYTLPRDFLYPIYCWSPDLGARPKIKILTLEQFRNKYPDEADLTGYPTVATFEGRGKIQLYGGTACEVGVIYHRVGGLSDLLANDQSFLNMALDACESGLQDAVVRKEDAAFNRYWRRLDMKAKMDASHFEPIVEIEPDELLQGIQDIRRAYL